MGAISNCLSPTRSPRARLSGSSPLQDRSATGVPPPLRSIQALRALAALSVAAYHALQWGPGGFDVGRAGVDVFFVISGVIMWRVTQRRIVTPADFLWRRLTRVAPLYWLTTLAVLGVAVVWPGFLPQVRPGWGHLLLSLSFIPHLDPAGLPFPTLPPGWTLNYEAGFYLVFAAALAGPRAWRAQMVICSLLAVTLAGFELPDPVYFLGANPMLLQFAAGVALGCAAEHHVLPSPPWGVAMIAAAGVAWIWVQRGGVFSEVLRPLLWGVPALLTVAGAMTIELGRRPQSEPPPRALRLAARAIVMLGDASYAIYLLHLPATAVVAHTIGVGRLWLFLPLAITASTLAGLAAHIWVEKPLQRWVRAISPPAAWKKGWIPCFRRS